MLQSWYQSAGLPVPTGGTSFYYKGRARLNVAFLKEVFEKVSNGLAHHEYDQDRWKGMMVSPSRFFEIKLLILELIWANTICPPPYFNPAR